MTKRNRKESLPNEKPSAEMAEQKLADALTGLTDDEKADVWAGDLRNPRGWIDATNTEYLYLDESEWDGE